jgi:hypothetical protein
MLLEVFGEYNCLSGMYAKNFTTGSADISLGKITVSSGLSASITGNVNNCNNAAVTDGFIIMQKDGLNYYQALSSTGTFSFVTGLCDNNTPVSFFAEDKSTSKASDATTFTILPVENAIGTLIACKVSTLQFLNYSVNGVNYSITAPLDSLTQYAKPQNTPPSVHIVGSKFSSTMSTSVTMLLTGIKLNSLQNLMSFGSPEIETFSTIATPINVKITEYGLVGQYIAGNFSGTYKGPAPGNILYQVTCSFRVKRVM